MRYEVLTQTLPDNFDWRKQKVVTEVKDQGKLDVSDVFAVVGAIESCWAIRTGNLNTLSEQQLVDCGRNETSANLREVFESVSSLGGLAPNSSYPYVAQHQQCKLNKTEISVRIEGHLKMHNEEAMARYLMAKGPFVVAFNGKDSLASYKGGIVNFNSTQCPPTKLSQAGLVVGFGVEAKMPFWILKNSRGGKWGENGYFRIARGSNTCGIASNVYSPFFDVDIGGPNIFVAM
ncbi:hypothetical protein L596_023747 [Steinernema carpocapsae]|uniref:Peptidase C1A papain C-terminal domain-containing protein n=1 Tax=Steinernema carpocapsae TaxID=34508 RepID=A0A4U5MEN0_STECR|nr:hypothetical protein L596_023747 [Steinernema carpocapsae]